jgi:hypothetical protein
MFQVQFGQAPTFFWWILSLSIAGSLLVGSTLGGAAKVIRAVAEYVWAKNFKREQQSDSACHKRAKGWASGDLGQKT